MLSSRSTVGPTKFRLSAPIGASGASRSRITGAAAQSTPTKRAEDHASSDASVQPAWKQFVASYVPPDDVAKVQAPPGCPPVVVLPGFGNSSEDYTSPFGCTDAAIATQLSERGFQVHVVPVERKDWLKVAKGVLSLGFWRGQLTTHPSYSWYLQRVRDTVQNALSEPEVSQVILVGHSAGGWLARAFTGDPQWFVDAAACTPDALALRASGSNTAKEGQQVISAIAADSDALGPVGAQQGLPSVDEDDTGPAEAASGTCSPTPNPAVAAIVTLGSPQRPPSTGLDVTGGAQKWVDTSFPGAFYKDMGIGYVCVCGKTVEGVKRDVWKMEDPSPPSYAFNSYAQVCGDGATVGDAVVPLQSAFLDGAECLELEGVFHSMSRLGTYSEASEYPWYGSSQVLDRWLAPLVVKLKGLPQ